MPLSDRAKNYFKKYGTAGKKPRGENTAPKHEPQKNTVTSTPHDSNQVPETAENNNPEQPLKRESRESNAAYHNRQKAENQKKEQEKQSAENPQNKEKGFMERGVDRGKNYAKEQLGKASGAINEKAKDVAGKGIGYAKDKGKEFLDNNPKVGGAINKAQQVKRGFEDKMNRFKDNAELSARKPALKQGEDGRTGETDKEFLERQRAAEKNGPENQQKMSLKNATIQHGKNKVNEQLNKGKNFIGQKAQNAIKANPKLAEKAEKIKALQEKLAKANAFKKKIKALKDKYDVKKLAKKKIDDEIKRIKMEIAKAAARFAIQILISLISALSAILPYILAVVLIIVVIIAALESVCKSNPAFDFTCRYFIGF